MSNGTIEEAKDALHEQGKIDEVVVECADGSIVAGWVKSYRAFSQDVEIVPSDGQPEHWIRWDRVARIEIRMLDGSVREFTR